MCKYGQASAPAAKRYVRFKVMKKAIIENLIFGAIMMIPFILMDFLWVKSGQHLNSIWNNRVIQTLLLLSVPAGLFIINKRYNDRIKEPLKLVVPFLIAIGVAAIWAFLGLTVLVNFHNSIGGTI
jgi:hypothetical protein